MASGLETSTHRPRIRDRNHYGTVVTSKFERKSKIDHPSSFPFGSKILNKWLALVELDISKWLSESRGSLVVKVIYSWPVGHKFEPRTHHLGEMHVKSVESSNVFALV
ncbi:hypothetical protein TNCV_2126691 [Trichonephila clavipes]|nr:hypothetical protein TNCV_2126691 [Trichonephila clavipes]